MALNGNNPEAEYAQSRLLQRGTVAEYQKEFEMLISQVTGKSDSLLASIYIFGLKPALQRALLWSNLTTLGEAFSLAQKDNAKPPIFIGTVGNNGGNDSRTSGSETPAKEVVDKVEQKSLGNKKELDNESKDRKVERGAKREGEPTILGTFGSDRGVGNDTATVISKEDLKGTRTEYGFKRAFMSLFGQDDDTFTSTMLFNVDQLQKQLDKDDFQEDGSMASFWVINRQIEVKQFRETLLQHMSNIKKFVAERTRHQRQYDRRVNKRQMQMQENKVDLGKALDADLFVTESSGTESGKQDTSSKSGNDTDADDAYIIPIYDEEPMAEVQLTIECNIFATRQQHTEQPEIINEGQHGQILNEASNKAKRKKEIDAFKTIDIELEHNIQEKFFAIAALKNKLRKSKRNSVDTKFAKPSVLGKPLLQPLRNQSVVRQSTTFKSERPKISKPQFASQVDVEKYFSKPVTQHYLPKEREYALAKPHHMIASSESRNSSKNMPIFSSNDMVHNHYLDEARKKTQERDRNSKTSVMPSARFQSTADGSKQKRRSINQSTRSLPTSKSSCVTITVVPKADHSRNTSSFSDSKHFVCSTCQKCVFNANHNACMTKFLKDVNSRAKIQFYKTRNSNKPKTSPRSGLRWKPTGIIFETDGLRWIPIVKLLDSCMGKVDSEPPHGSNVDISKTHECKKTQDLSAGTSINVQKEQSFNLSEGTYNNVKQDNLQSSAVPTADAFDKHQQQPDLTSSTSTLATIVTADGNFTLIHFSIHSDDGNPSSVNIKQHCDSIWEIVSHDDEEEVASFQDKYDHVVQKHKLINKVTSR
ncbi:hypothetical protein Tco_0121595 [Tanacetum coccineum]